MIVVDTSAWIDYENRKSNYWVPYPINSVDLLENLKKVGFINPHKVHIDERYYIIIGNK